MNAFIDRYFDAFFNWSPSYGTASGFHEYDTRIEDLSAAAITRRIDELKSMRSEVAGLRATKLSESDAIDAEIIESQIQSELLDLETIATWRTNPMFYAGVPGNAIDVLMKRTFAPANERLKSIVARLKGVPAILLAMKENVQNPPKEFTDLALAITRGASAFFKADVAIWAKDAAGTDQALFQQFEAANASAVRALDEAASWLETTLLPNSKGKYAIGPELYAKKLLYDEMEDTPLDKLLAIAEANLEKDFNALIETAREIDPSKTAAELVKAMSDDHPSEKSLIPDARQTVEAIIDFIKQKRIVTIPSEVRPNIIETPGFLRSYGFAMMDTPGAYETKATEAFYYVTPPESTWDAKTKEEHLRQFNKPVMEIITVHEAYPGHYIQFLYAPKFPTKTRKLLWCGSNVEGWAHYTEQMMVEEGYGGNDPQIRLAQLHEALIRDARFVVGIKLHTAGWTVEQGAKFFEERALHEPANAYSEARRGAYNPTYLYYTLGKLQIYKLREDYRQARGASYSLEGFHNEFVAQGGIQIKLIRRILLPGDTRPTL